MKKVVLLMAVVMCAVPAMADFADTFDTGISSGWDTITSATSVPNVGGITAIGGGMASVGSGGTLVKYLAAPEQGDMSVYYGHSYNGSSPIEVAFGNSVDNSQWLFYYNANNNSIYARFIYQGTTVYNNPTTLAGSDILYHMDMNVSDAGTAITISSAYGTWSSATSGIGGWDPYMTSVDTLALGNNSNANMFFDEFNWTTVPEPASMCLLAAGGLFAVARRRRK